MTQGGGGVITNVTVGWEEECPTDPNLRAAVREEETPPPVPGCRSGRRRPAILVFLAAAREEEYAAANADALWEEEKRLGRKLI